MRPRTALPLSTAKALCLLGSSPWTHVQSDDRWVYETHLSRCTWTRLTLRQARLRPKLGSHCPPVALLEDLFPVPLPSYPLSRGPDNALPASTSPPTPSERVPCPDRARWEGWERTLGNGIPAVARRQCLRSRAEWTQGISKRLLNGKEPRQGARAWGWRQDAQPQGEALPGAPRTATGKE